MKKSENLKEMLKARLRDIDKSLKNFDKARHLSYAEFEAHLDDRYPPVTVGQYAFMPSKVLFNLDMGAFLEMFRDWAETVPYEDINEYAQLKDEREQVLDWLEEIS